MLSILLSVTWALDDSWCREGCCFTAEDAEDTEEGIGYGNRLLSMLFAGTCIPAVSNALRGFDWCVVLSRLRRKRSAVIVLSLVIGVSASVWFINKYYALEAEAVAQVVVGTLRPRPTIEQVETRRLRRLSGWFSRSCGHVRRHTDAETAIACAQSALKAGQSFYVSFDFVGIDSHGAIGLAADSKRTVYEVITDDGWFQDNGTLRNGVNVTVTRCETPPIELVGDPRNRYLTCHPN
jgi:hypothetical protein